MPKPEPPKSPPLKVATWPRSLNRQYIGLCLSAAAFFSLMIFELLYGRLDRLPWEFALFMTLLFAYGTYRFIITWRCNRIIGQLPALLCPTCGYDLCATPLRCPECGNDTPFKLWLDEHPLDKVLYEKQLEAKSPG